MSELWLGRPDPPLTWRRLAGAPVRQLLILIGDRPGIPISRLVQLKGRFHDTHHDVVFEDEEHELYIWSDGQNIGCAGASRHRTAMLLDRSSRTTEYFVSGGHICWVGEVYLLCI